MRRRQNLPQETSCSSRCFPDSTFRAACANSRSHICCCKARTASSIVIESVRTAEPRVQGQGICLLRQDQQPRKICDFGMTPVTSSSLVPTSTSNESHTRSDELRARSKFTTHDSHTRVDELRARSRFATRGRDRQTTGNHRAQRAPQQGAQEKNSTALRYHVCRVSALCPARKI